MRRDVICAPACNAGPHRNPGEPPCRRPAHRRTSCKEPHPREAGQVRAGTGFLPPADYRRAVALLHRPAGGKPAENPFSRVLTAGQPDEGGRRYRVPDPAMRRRFAGEYGTGPAGKNDAGIAHAAAPAGAREERG